MKLDRKESEIEYDNFNNIVFACYWCNNAKTDIFTEEEFKTFGKAFKNIWQKRLKEPYVLFGDNTDQRE